MNKPLIVYKLRSFPEKSETFIVNNIVAAIEVGYDVVILCNEKKGLADSSQSETIQKYDLLSRTIQFRQPKNQIKRITQSFILLFRPGFLENYIRLIRYSKNFTLSYIFQMQYYEKVRESSAIHIHFPTHPSLVYELKQSGFLKSKLISTFHGYDVHYNSISELGLLKKKLKLIYEMSEFITVNTPYLNQKLEDAGGKFRNLRIIPMGIDTHKFKGQTKILPEVGPVKLISIGRLIELKGHKYAIDAVASLINSGFNLQYTIVGNGDLKNDLQSQIETRNMSKHIRLIGAKKQNEIIDLLNENHIFLMPSRTDSTGRAESQGVVTLEAQAMGLPVIAFDSGGIQYTLIHGQTGFLVPEKQIHLFSDAILNLIKSKYYERMSDESIAFIQNNFNQNSTFKAFQELYRKSSNTLR